MTKVKAKAKAGDYIICKERVALLEKDVTDIPEEALVVTPAERQGFAKGDILKSPEMFYSKIMDITKDRVYMSERIKSPKPGDSLGGFSIWKEDMETKMNQFKRVHSKQKKIILTNKMLSLFFGYVVRYTGDGLNPAISELKTGNTYLIANERNNKEYYKLIAKTTKYLSFITDESFVPSTNITLSHSILHSIIVVKDKYNDVIIQPATVSSRDNYKIVSSLEDIKRKIPEYEDVEYLFNNN